VRQIGPIRGAESCGIGPPESSRRPAPCCAAGAIARLVTWSPRVPCRDRRERLPYRFGHAAIRPVVSGDEPPTESRRLTSPNRAWSDGHNRSVSATHRSREWGFLNRSGADVPVKDIHGYRKNPPVRW